MNSPYCPADLAEMLPDIADFYAGFEGFAAIPGHPDYLVSNLGRVMSCKALTPRILSPFDNGTGYHQVVIRAANGKFRHQHVHRLVLMAHIGPQPDDHEAAHGNGRRADNRLRNLRWASRADNAADRLRHGTSNRIHCGDQPVTAEVVANILNDHTMTAQELAQLHGLSRHIVASIRRGTAYRYHCPDLPRRNRSTNTH